MKGFIVAGMMAASVVAHAGDFKQVVAEAYSINKQAATVGFEWRDTETSIQQAQIMHSKGRTTEAMELALFAKKQAILSLQQSVDQAKAGPNF